VTLYLRDIITDALGEIGVLGAGAVPTADMAAHALRRFNDLQGQYAANPELISKVTRTEFTITSGTQDYNVGSGQTVNITRPALNAVQSIAFLDTTITPNQEFSRFPPYTEEEWAAVPVKALTGTYPERARYNPTTPYGTLTLFPKPTSTTLKGVLYALEAISQFTDVATALDMPDEYRRMFVKNLALELAPVYQREPSKLLVDQARESRGIVRASNFRPQNMKFPAETLISPNCASPWYDITRG